MASKVDMSLDDIIKTSKMTRGRGRGRGGPRRGLTRGGRRGRGTGTGRNAVFERSIRQVSTGRIRKPRRGNLSTSIQSGRWEHDRFEGGAGAIRRRGGSVSTSRRPVKLVLSNLDFGVNDQDLKELFGEFGGFVKAYVHYDISGRSNGTAFIMFSSEQAAEQARKQYHGVQLDGRPMDIQLIGSGAANTNTAATLRVGGRGGRSSLRGGRGGASFARGGGGIGRGRGRGRGRGGRGGKVPTKEELDSQLDNYHSRTD